MKLHSLTCPHCSQNVTLDTDLGQQLHCPSCGESININRQRKTVKRRRSSLRFGDTVYTVSNDGSTVSSSQRADRDTAARRIDLPEPPPVQQEQPHTHVAANFIQSTADGGGALQFTLPVSSLQPKLVQPQAQEEVKKVTPRKKKKTNTPSEQPSSESDKNCKQTAPAPPNEHPASVTIDSQSRLTSTRYTGRPSRGARIRKHSLVAFSVIGGASILIFGAYQGIGILSNQGSAPGFFSAPSKWLTSLTVSVRKDDIETPQAVPTTPPETLNHAPRLYLASGKASEAKNEIAAKQVQGYQLARKQLIRFLECSDINSRITTVRDPETVASKMVRYYNHHDDGPIAYKSIEEIGIEDTQQHYVAFKVTLDGTGEEILAGIELTENGPLVDWESFVRYSEMEWDEIMNSKPTSPVMVRAFVQPSDYYNFQFSDSDRFASFSISTPSGRGDVLYGYMSRDDPDYREIARLASMSAGQPIPLVFRISFPMKTKGENLVKIDELISNGWMIRDHHNSQQVVSGY